MWRVLGTALVIALAAAAIWVASTGGGSGSRSDDRRDTPASAYDYEAHDVLVQQMDAGGTLQYELEARHIAQLPSNGQISAKDLVIHHDPAGTAPGTNRWTLTAQRADLPGSGKEITLQGQVHMQGRPPDSQAVLSLATERLNYNLQTQDVLTSKPVDITWGGISLHCGSLQSNIKHGTFGVNGTTPVDSRCHGTILP